MPTPSPPGADEIRVHPEAFERMAKAAEAAGANVRPRHRDGTPNAGGLFGGKTTGTPNVIFNSTSYAPHNRTLALMARRYAEWRGITWYEALGELCELAPVEEPSPQRVAA